MADKVSKKERLTEIQKAEILKDNVKKITKHQKLYTEYFWNKYNTMHVIPGKPNSYADMVESSQEDEHWKKEHVHHKQEPYHKYNEPLTSSQEIGWMNQHMVFQDRNDSRLYFGRKSCPITQYMDSAIKQLGGGHLQPCRK